MASRAGETGCAAGSGGQRQLALIARAQETGIVVIDKPTASLDLANRVLVLGKVKVPVVLLA